MTDSHSDPFACPLCKRRMSRERRPSDAVGTIVEFSCDRCGDFAVTSRVLDLDLTARTASDLAKVSALTRERTIHRKSRFVLFQEAPSVTVTTGAPVVLDDLLNTHWPADLVERTDRLLLNLRAESDHFGKLIQFDPDDLPFFFAVTKDEVHYFHKHLVDTDLIEIQIPRHLKLTPRAWEYIQEIERRLRTLVTTDVFVAMSFSDKMRPVYDNGIRKAIEETGFNPRRVDQLEFSGDILDEIIALLRASRFVVADFTENKNGVYFEAGYARGLGLKVIWTCRSDEVKNLHFDINHFHHITWRDAADLRKRLVNRIRAEIV